MQGLQEITKTDPGLRFLLRQGEMRTRIREFDWSSTELGAPASWSTSLKTAMAIMLDCAAPAYIAWGPRFVQVYNDAYIPILGERKHPGALGITTPETWHEIWEIIGPMFQAVFSSGESFSMENKLLPMQRNGYLEECYFNFSYSPISDETGRVVGVFVMPWETTLEFVANRRANAIRLLVQGLSEAVDMAGIHAAFEKTILECPQDLPFGLWYEQRPNYTGLDLVTAAGIQRGSGLSPEFLDPEHDGFYAGTLDINAPVTAMRVIDDDLLRWSRQDAPNVNPQYLFAKPLCYTNDQRPDGYIVLAANPMRPNDEEQKNFLLTIRLHLENAVRRVNKGELDRREHEHQLQTLMSVLPCFVWLSDTAKQCTFVNQQWLNFTGRRFEQELGNGWMENVHPDDVKEAEGYFNAFDARTSLSLEYRFRNADGDWRWILIRGMPRYDVSGKFLGYIGTCIDISDRKKAEQDILASQAELRTLYDRLQTAREEERCALAREVHDQLGQILSAAKIDIKLLDEEVQQRHKPLTRKRIATELQSAGRILERALQVVKRLATELRPPELVSQGLPAAIQWHARDFEKRTKIRCSVTLPPDMFQLSDAEAIALFGIFQEAMTNILRHAKASRVWITLEAPGNQVRLRVRDNGIGIGSVRRCSAKSMGIRGMRERAAVAGGRLVIGALPSSGTLVAVRIPRARNNHSAGRKINSASGANTGDAV